MLLWLHIETGNMVVCLSATMVVISLVSQKGGAGNTTIAVGLAVAHELAGGYAVLVDLDPQGSASVWSDLRDADRPVAVATHVPRLARVLDAAREGGAQLAVIDTAPHASDAALATAQASDLILVPCRPSVADLHAIRASLDICRVAQGRARVVLNAVPVQGPLGGQAREAIAGHRATVAPMGALSAHRSCPCVYQGDDCHGVRTAVEGCGRVCGPVRLGHLRKVRSLIWRRTTVIHSQPR